MKPTFSSKLREWTTRFGTWRRAHPYWFATGVTLTVVGLLGITALITLIVLAGKGSFGPAPTAAALRGYDQEEGSIAYSAEGHNLGRFYAKDRITCTYADLPEHLVQALVVTEDGRFYDHAGIDWNAYGRVFFKTILGGQEDQGGGSTISQQVVKNCYGRPELGYGASVDLGLHKLREAVVARRMEKAMNKERVVERYFNTVAFPGNTYGIAAASKRYFQKPPKELTLRESAALVATLKGTSVYDPRRFPQRNRERANRTLRMMAAAGYLDEQQLESALADTLRINFQRPSPYAGLASHFTVAIRKEAERLADNAGYDLLTDNLRVYTTLDTSLQRHAEAALRSQLKEHQEAFVKHLAGQDPWATEASLRAALRGTERYRKGRAAGKDSTAIMAEFNQPYQMELTGPGGLVKNGEFSPLDSLRHHLTFLRAGFVVLDHATGEVRAWVGGPDFQFDQYDHVLSQRQTGSTFKPIVYAAALRDGYDPCYELSNEQVTYGDNYTPGNSNGEYGGKYSMHGALSHSVNTAAVGMTNTLGLEKVIRMARELGLESDLPPILGLALGTAEGNLLERTGAYATFPAGGQFRRPYFISRIETSDGKTIYERKDEASTVLDANQAATMVAMMKFVVDRGTAGRLKWEHGVQRPTIGKTGTTQHMADGWYIGSTPNLTGGAWVGGVNNGIRFKSGHRGNGSRSALPIWADFIKRVERDTALGDAALGVNFPPIPAAVQNSLYCPEFTEPDTLMVNDWEDLEGLERIEPVRAVARGLR